MLWKKSIISTDTKTKFSLPTIFFRTCASGKSKQGRRIEVAFYNSVSLDFRTTSGFQILTFLYENDSVDTYLGSDLWRHQLKA